MEVLQAEGQVTRNRHRKIILAHEGRFHVVGKSVETFFHIGHLRLGVKMRGGVHHERLIRSRFGRSCKVANRGSRFFGHRFGFSCRFRFGSSFFDRFFCRSFFDSALFCGRFRFGRFCNRFFGAFFSCGSGFFYGRSRIFEFFGRRDFVVHLGQSQRRAAKQSRK